MEQFGPTLPFSQELHKTKYQEGDEGFVGCKERNAGAMCDDQAHADAYLDATLNMRFMEAGRVQRAMGSRDAVTAYNCFVSGTIADSFVHDGDASIMGRATQAAATMRMGGGIGYDFSTIRPSGDVIQGVNATTRGPLAFMPIYDGVCSATESAGSRRGAQMAVLRVDHPDIFDFIEAKQNDSALRGFNVSVAATDAFMHAVQTDGDFDLQWGGRTRRTIRARGLWDKLMESTRQWAEPGVLFIDTINRMNNLWYCETIAATNPCGEQPLPPFGACLLGSFNLTRYLYWEDGRWRFDWVQFYEDIHHVVRAMDNVVDQAQYPLPEQELEAKSKRRMGLGVTGLANAGEALGWPYGTAGFIEFERAVLETLKVQAYAASARLAAEKGPFPLFDRERYLAGEFVRTLPTWVRELIGEHGIRNSHLTSIAPTGTISFCADYVSGGVEPVFGFESVRGSGVYDAYQGRRKVIMPDGPVWTDVADYGHRVFGVEGRHAQTISTAEHVAVLAEATRHVDSAVSKTVNVAASCPDPEFRDIYLNAWRFKCKGLTTFTDGGMREGIMGGTDEGASCQIVDGLKVCG